MSKFVLKTSLTALLLPTVATANMPNVTLDDEVITVSKMPTNTSQAPTRINVLNEVQIKKNPTRNLSDIIQQDAGIYVKQSGGIGQVPEVSIRGTYPVHTLVLKDGARLNSQNHVSAVYTGFMDAANLSRIEIAKGPASVQYGSDAIGGVIQMVSKTPTRTGAKITGIIGENDTYKAIVSGDIVHDDFYASLSGQRLETDGTRIFNNQGRDNKAGYEQKGYTAKVGFDNKQNINASISFEHNEGINEFNSGGALNNAPREFENQLTNAKLSYKLTDYLTLNARYSNVKNNQTVTAYQSFYNTKIDEADVNAKWAFTDTQNILVGINTNQSKYISNTVKDGSQSIDTIGYYAQHQYNSDKLNTQVGIRLEDNERFGNHTVGQGAIRYHFTPKTSVYANIGSAFRAPALSELYYFDEQPWGNTYGNPELKPEESTSYEVGVNHQIKANLALSLSAYKTDIKNLIAYSYGHPNSTYENINKAKIAGGELGLKYNRGDYYVMAQYGLADAKNKETDLTIAYRPKHTGTLTLGYDDGVVGVSTSLVARSKANAQNSVNSLTVPGYATVDMNIHWYINNHVKLFGNIENIGDVEYKTAHYFGNQWYVNGGRQANVGVTLNY